MYLENVIGKSKKMYLWNLKKVFGKAKKRKFGKSKKRKFGKSKKSICEKYLGNVIGKK